MKQHFIGTVGSLCRILRRKQPDKKVILRLFALAENGCVNNYLDAEKMASSRLADIRMFTSS